MTDNTAAAPRLESTTSGWSTRIRPGIALAWLVLALIAVAVLWPALLASHTSDEVDVVHAFSPPSADHLLGTDRLGRDVYARIVYGARISVTVGVGAMLLGLIPGAVLGVLAAAGGSRIVSRAVMLVADILIAFPGILLALLIAAVLGAGTVNMMLAIAFSTLPGFIRLARAQALVVRESDYVRIATTLGTRRAAVLVRHVFPNVLPPLLVMATVSIGTTIIAGSALGFLGLGPQAPTPEWGAMLAESRDFLDVAWWTAVFPGLALTLTVIAISVVGRDARHRIEGSPHAGR